MHPNNERPTVSAPPIQTKKLHIEGSKLCKCGRRIAANKPTCKACAGEGK